MHIYTKKGTNEHKPIGAFLYIILFRLLLKIILWSLVDQVHELVELRSDDDLCTTVTHLAHLSIIGCYRVVLATTTSSHTLRI